MVRYCVYLVCGRTTRGTRRRYVGYTRSLVLRQFWHGLKVKPCWMRCLKPEETRYDVLQSGFEALGEALCSEAVLAAKEILKCPLTARGGPWSSPKKLTEDQLALVRKVAKCRELEELYSLTGDKRTALARHLANVPFEHQAVEEGPRVFLRTSNKSGTPGNRMRRMQLWDGCYERNDENHKVAHRGVDWQARRTVETSRRPLRRKKKCVLCQCRGKQEGKKQKPNSGRDVCRNNALRGGGENSTRRYLRELFRDNSKARCQAP